jgi:hypothetical protein
MGPIAGPVAAYTRISEAHSVPVANANASRRSYLHIVIPWLVVQTLLTGFDTTHKKDSPEEPPVPRLS